MGCEQSDIMPFINSLGNEDQPQGNNHNRNPQSAPQRSPAHIQNNVNATYQQPYGQQVYPQPQNYSQPQYQQPSASTQRLN
jgi:hypothetical protein